MILGMDADTFELNGGSEYFKQAQTIANYSQQLNGQGWKLEDGLQSRFALIDNLMSPTFKEFRTTMYEYHINGLDLMHEDTKKGKTKVTSVLEELQKIHRRRPNSYLLRVFFDAKSDEIVNLYSDGPNTRSKQRMLVVVKKISPVNNSKWQKIN